MLLTASERHQTGWGRVQLCSVTSRLHPSIVCPYTTKIEIAKWTKRHHTYCPRREHTFVDSLPMHMPRFDPRVQRCDDEAAITAWPAMPIAVEVRSALFRVPQVGWSCHQQSMLTAVHITSHALLCLPALRFLARRTGMNGSPGSKSGLFDESHAPISLHGPFRPA
jgi:hypothetical protein